MCGRYTLHLSWQEIHDLLQGFVDSIRSSAPHHIAKAPDRYNIAPTQPILVLKRSGSRVEPELMRWGLVPEWVDNPVDFPLIINARAETLAEKTSFKTALKNRRCIIPASGYYEWRKDKDGQKTPIYITRKDARPFLMAGLHATWVGPDGEEVDTAAIVTVPAVKDIKQVHGRTPAMLEGAHIDGWLDTGRVNATSAQKLLKPMANGVADFYPVSKRVNSVRNDDPELIIPAYEDDRSKAAEKKASEAPKATPISEQLDLFGS